MLYWIVRFIRFASFVVCAIVIASFVVFVVTQTKSASNHQTEEVATASATAAATGSTATSPVHEGSLHRRLDEASERLTSPFAGLVSGSNSEWVIRGVKLLLALAVYGFGVGYLVRVLRVRV